MSKVLIQLGIDLGFFAFSNQSCEENSKVQFFNLEVDGNQSLISIVHRLFEEEEISGIVSSQQAKHLIQHMSVHLAKNDTDISTIVCNQAQD